MSQTNRRPLTTPPLQKRPATSKTLPLRPLPPIQRRPAASRPTPWKQQRRSGDGAATKQQGSGDGAARRKREEEGEENQEKKKNEKKRVDSNCGFVTVFFPSILLASQMHQKQSKCDLGKWISHIPDSSFLLTNRAFPSKNEKIKQQAIYPGFPNTSSYHPLAKSRGGILFQCYLGKSSFLDQHFIPQMRFDEQYSQQTSLICMMAKTFKNMQQLHAEGQFRSKSLNSFLKSSISKSFSAKHSGTQWTLPKKWIKQLINQSKHASIKTKNSQKLEPPLKKKVAVNFDQLCPNGTFLYVFQAMK